VWTDVPALQERATTTLAARPVAAGFGIGFALSGGLGASNGGYWPSAWAWLALAGGWSILVAVALRAEIALGTAAKLFVAALAAFALWTLASGAWSSSAGRSGYEFQRAAAYTVAVLALVIVVRARATTGLLAGSWAGISLVSLYALGTRLFPERLGIFDPTSGYRLSSPLGYSNALGIYAVLGALLATGLAVHARLVALRSLAAASLLVLVPTLYFTFSRGASIALVLGLLVAVAVDVERLRYIATLIPTAAFTAIAVAVSSHADALTHTGAPLATASREGHRIAFLLVVLALLSASCTAGICVVERRISVAAPLRRAFAYALLAIAIAVPSVVLVRAGGPLSLADRAARDFRGPTTTDPNLNLRLLSFSGNARVDEWRVALRSFRDHPLHGTGAGTYEEYWALERPSLLKVRDAHSLYFEVLGELGIVGLVLVLGFAGVPLVALVRARRQRLVPAATAVFAAWAFHAGIDWDWEMPAVTLTAFLAGIVGIVAFDRAPAAAPSRRRRAAAVAAAAVFSAVAVVAVAGNTALTHAWNAAGDGDWAASASAARTARRWLPWSALPLQALAEADLALGRPGPAARAARAGIAKDPRNWQLWFDLALAVRGRSRVAAARVALRLNPRSPELAADSSILGLGG
jgi:O-antigen ligase/polysaccharide polymerase Wzy-like membrane protein